MSAVWLWLIRQGLRRGWQRGLVDGNRAWVIVGGAALLGHLLHRYGGRKTDVIVIDELPAGETWRIADEPPS